MRYLRLVLIAGVLFGACSCSERAHDLSVNLSKPDQIRCQAGPDCELKWKRAYTWVLESSGLKLQSKTDGLIKTVEPPGVDRTLVVIITKNRTAQSSIYEIDFIGKCSSSLSCVPSAAESRTSFANFVSAANQYSLGTLSLDRQLHLPSGATSGSFAIFAAIRRA